MSSAAIKLPRRELEQFCAKWSIRELALFGSVLRDDFSDTSDIDVLVTFDETSEWGLFALVEMQNELRSLFRRPVDIVNKRALEKSTNWLRRDTILRSAIPLRDVSS